MRGKPTNEVSSSQLGSSSSMQTELCSKGHKRKTLFNEGKEHTGLTGLTVMRKRKRGRIVSKTQDCCDPFNFPNLLDGLDYSKFGSAAKDIEALCARKRQTPSTYVELHPTLPYARLDVEKNQNMEASNFPQRTSSEHKNVIDLEDDHSENYVPAVAPSVIILDSDEECANQGPSSSCEEVVLSKPASEPSITDLMVENYSEGKAPTEEEESISNETSETVDDSLADIWKEMEIALEYSKDTAVDSLSDEHVIGGGDDCDHSFVLRDDLGYVCRICGIIQRSIDTIFEFQYGKTTRTTRTYMSETWNKKDREPVEILPHGVKLSEHESTVTHVFAHPRHMKQMKPHQVEGFNFLLQNLVTDNPGGCILAHAPGSGKTFMIISFVQSFLAKYPNARPLVVLPKGILATWKKEFQRWQIEDVPLFDFYSSKAENRSQQLDVLKKWVEQKSILFLGYKQFSSIVCHNEICQMTAACREILLKAPSVLILDEGHTPRNENTDVLHSLAEVQTPRKVVLSGTLFHNHVKEVFNILNLVRPRFLKLDTSRALVKRIISKVQIAGARRMVKSSANSTFYDLVQNTLQKDDDFRRKVSVIQDLREMTSKVLHYYKGDFLEELPGLVDFTVHLTLSAKQRTEVEKLKKLDNFKRNSVGSAVYVHPCLKMFAEKNPAARDRSALVNDEKIDEIIEKLNVKDGVKAKFFLGMLGLCELTGEKLLVFSQYLLPLKFLERLAKRVKGWSPGKETFMISGDSNSELREWSMECFNGSADAKIFFGSIKACGEGISLVGASRILILDVHLNPSVTRQAIGRAFRPGQQRKVYTYRLVAADSPEEEDHLTSFRKEMISKLWFEWDECCVHQDYEMSSVDVKDCGDTFLGSPLLGEDIKALFKR
ncbi:protein CHROMATIN REMODELING 35-like isoform X4 [Malania oleifera]|nr:protein CHROMATIN REMODELING 35-like isoform X4 [Malania oleifera]